MLTLVCSGVILVQSYGLYAMEETRLEPTRLGRAYSARPDQNQLTGLFIDIENKTPRSFRVLGYKGKWGPLSQPHKLGDGPDLWLTPSTYAMGWIQMCMCISTSFFLHSRWSWRLYGWRFGGCSNLAMHLIYSAMDIEM